MVHNDHGGLHEDLKLTGARIGRRDMLRLAAGGMSALYLLGCSDGVLGVGEGDADGACDAIPEETAGPFPPMARTGPTS